MLGPDSIPTPGEDRKALLPAKVLMDVQLCITAAIFHHPQSIYRRNQDDSIASVLQAIQSRGDISIHFFTVVHPHQRHPFRQPVVTEDLINLSHPMKLKIDADIGGLVGQEYQILPLTDSKFYFCFLPREMPDFSTILPIILFAIARGIFQTLLL
jgi:hypothetical protein